MEKRIILWSQYLDNLLTESNSLTGGIPVQMYMWAKIFDRNGWTVYSFTSNPINKNKKIEIIQFIKYPSVRFINPFLSLLVTIYAILKIQPKYILLFGASRDLLFISLICKILRVRLIMLFASDSDLEKGKEFITRSLDRRCYRLGLHYTSNFIVQNEQQEMDLNLNYKRKKYISVPIIWSIVNNNHEQSVRDIILWVGNIRGIKRPGWFIQLAKTLPDKKFKMVGGSLDTDLFNDCKKECNNMPNIEFSGALSFQETQKCFNQAYLFINTSETEGFPNTYIQAWSNSIPVIATFDPSNVIQNKHLGIYCSTLAELKEAVEIMDNKTLYGGFQTSIKDYFESSHSPQKYFDELTCKFSVK